MKQFKLGDVVEKALATVGVTEERVAKALGRPCGCKRRKEMLNRLSLWAARVVTGKTEDAEKYLEEIINESEAKSPQAPDTNGGRPAPLPTAPVVSSGDRESDE